MKKFVSGINRFFKDVEGATAVEYAIMVALIAVAVIVTVRILGQRVNELFELFNTTLGVIS